MENPTRYHPALQDPVAQPLHVRRADLGLSTPWEEPQSETEMRLAEIWQRVLDIDTVGRLDDFFELRGDSLAATSLAAEIEATFGIRFAPGDIISLSTVATQARAMAPSTLSPAPRVPPYMVVGRAEGSKPPLFMVHGAAGFSFFKRDFLDTVGHDRPVYLFQAPGFDGRTEPLKTVEEIASAYIKSIREIQPMGPYHLAAMCAGSFIALEMCNQLADSGQSVARLILLDPSPAPRALARRYPNRNKWSHRFQAKGNSGWGRYIMRRIRWAWTGASDSFEQEMKTRAKMLKRKEAIRQRREGQTDGASPEERSYSSEKMLAASQQLYEALNTYVPRPYAGKAAVLVRTNRSLREIIGKRTFWRDHLSEIDCHHSDASHHDMFNTHIIETACFVKCALEHTANDRLQDWTNTCNSSAS
jgi:thioesterase domain-containing protein/acyl carrier protein